MITNIALDGFKAFRTADLRIKPITVLCGTNSSGKSSILQSILLMKQSLENDRRDQTLLLNGKYALLGRFEDIRFRRARDKAISFRIEFDLTAAVQAEVPELYPESKMMRDLLPAAVLDGMGDSTIMVRLF